MSETAQSSNEYYPIILDIGSRFIKAGFAGDPAPLAIDSTSNISSNYRSMELQWPSYFEVNDSSLTTEQRASIIANLRENSNVERLSKIYTQDINRWIPINTQPLSSYNEVTLIDKINRILCDRLIVSPKRTKIILIDSNLSILNKSKLIDMLLNKIMVKSVVLIPEAIASVISCNEQQGIVLNFNWELMSINLVFDLRILSNNSYEDSSRYNGLSLHYKMIEELIKLRNAEVYELLKSPESFEIIESFIVNAVYVRSIDDTSDYSGNFEIAQDIFVPNYLRYKVIEDIFFSDNNLTELIYSMVIKCGIDIRSELLNNLLILGGISNIPGFKSRLIQQLNSYIKDKNVTGKLALGSWSGCSLYISNTLMKTPAKWRTRELSRDTFNNLKNDNGNSFRLSGIPDHFNLYYTNLHDI